MSRQGQDPHILLHFLWERVPGTSVTLTSPRGSGSCPHPTVGDKGNGVRVEATTELRGKQGKEGNATNRAAEWPSRLATGIHCSAL